MKINFLNSGLYSFYNVQKSQRSENRANYRFSPYFTSNRLEADTFEKTKPSKEPCRTEKGRKRSRKTSRFKIKYIPNFRCPICEKITMSEEEITKYKRTVSKCKGEDLIRAIDELGDEYYWTGKEESKGKTIYRDKIIQVTEIIKDLARENPKLDLVGLVRIKSDECTAKLIDKQMDVLDKLEFYAYEKMNNEDEIRKLKSLINITKTFIRGDGDEYFKRKKFLRSLSRMNFSDPNNKRELLKIAQELPKSENDVDSFFVKYSQESRNCEEIARRFVAQNIPTAEHVVLFSSENGNNSKNNFICDCEQCNNDRGETPFATWIKQISRPQKKFQNYLNDVQKLLDSGELEDDYASYPAKMAQNLNDLSNNELHLKNPALLRNDKDKEKLKSVKQKKIEGIEENEARINSYYKELTSLVIRKTELNEELSDLRHKGGNSKKNSRKNSAYEKMQELKAEITNINNRIDKLHRLIKDAKKEIATAKCALKNMN